jgi:hypothetical protein
MRAEAPVRADAERRLATAHSLRKTFARILNSNARVVEWQTRTFEGRMPKGMRVQVPPRAPLDLPMRNDHLGVTPHSI